MAALTVERAAANGLAVYYRVAAGESRGEAVTVRQGKGGVLVCLTHLYDRRCAHIRAVEDYLHDTADVAA
jgi:hypothetical protein